MAVISDPSPIWTQVIFHLNTHLQMKDIVWMLLRKLNTNLLTQLVFPVQDPFCVILVNWKQCNTLYGLHVVHLINLFPTWPLSVQNKNCSLKWSICYQKVTVQFHPLVLVNLEIILTATKIFWSRPYCGCTFCNKHFSWSESWAHLFWPREMPVTKGKKNI